MGRVIKRRSKPRRGRVVDKAYLDFIASQPCMVTGQRPVTVHHVRQLGSPKNDRHTVPLIARLHMLVAETPGQPCVERGKKIFQSFHGVDLETEIVRLNELYSERFTELMGTAMRDADAAAESTFRI